MNGIQDFTYIIYDRGAYQAVTGPVPAERFLRIHVNGLELATVMASPVEPECLALGFLRSEGIIQGMDDVRRWTVCPSGACVDVWLRRADFEPPGRLIITSGCGGGVTFDDLAERAQPLDSTRQTTPEQISHLLHELQESALLYQEARGIHTAGLSDGERLLMITQDVGRHNTVDRLWGKCLLAAQSTADLILVSTGRISSEMLNKAAKMRIPIVASRTSPTALSIELARTWHITLIGYVRSGSLRVYANPERLQLPYLSDIPVSATAAAGASVRPNKR